jgi:FKBP-type peptidyl-prolyl cis-trans isomerase FkpA
MKRSHFLFIALLASASCNDDVTGLGPPSDPTKETFAASLGVDVSQMTRKSDGLFYSDVVVGTGPEVTDKTTSVNVTYAGFLKDGKLFQSGTNVAFDPAGVVPGFRSGLLGMKEGGKRKLVIPSDLGYGSRSRKESDGSITIPRQSTLIFDVEVIKVTNPAT